MSESSLGERLSLINRVKILLLAWDTPAEKRRAAYVEKALKDLLETDIEPRQLRLPGFE